MEEDMKPGQIDERINYLVNEFDKFRLATQITATETFLLLQVLELKVKNEIDLKKQEAFIQGGSLGGIMKQVQNMMGGH